MMFSQMACDDFDDLFSSDEPSEPEFMLKLLAIGLYDGFDQPQTSKHAWLCPLANLPRFVN